ncbi:MAG: GNAT family N-acetyltransferase [Verrucomicrobia bacterium]|nr:GNAT family N-acetyltransferase [Verrucomicrobiota bacterium]
MKIHLSTGKRNTLAATRETGAYRLRLAGTEADVAAAQRLRFEVFNLELAEGLARSVASGRDADEFDAVCDHLLVETRSERRVVGTYRLQTGARAAASGLGYYSAREFDFAPFEPVRGELVELGRACVDREHRNQTVLALLWRGIAEYAAERGARYLTGCSSLTSREASEGREAWAVLAERHWVEPRWRTVPLAGWSCDEAGVEEGVNERKTRRLTGFGQVKIPRLLGAYLALGAKLCGAPALDREFGTVDFLTWLDLQAVPERVLRKYLA